MCLIAMPFRVMIMRMYSVMYLVVSVFENGIDDLRSILSQRYDERPGLQCNPELILTFHSSLSFTLTFQHGRYSCGQREYFPFARPTQESNTYSSTLVPNIHCLVPPDLRTNNKPIDISLYQPGRKTKFSCLVVITFVWCSLSVNWISQAAISGRLATMLD